MGRVVHCKKDRYDVYIGRPSPYGNPFVIGKDGTRAEVIAKYRTWAENNLGIGHLQSLKGKVLGCWCAPEACHGDVLVEMADSIPDGDEEARLVNELLATTQQIGGKHE